LVIYTYSRLAIGITDLNGEYNDPFLKQLWT